MFKTRSLGERTRDTVQEGIEIGRATMERAAERGQQTLSRMRRPEPRFEFTNGWLWFAGGLAAALAVVGWRRADMLPWKGRRVDDVMARNIQTIDSSMNLTQAAQRMRDANVGVLPVVDGGRLKGIVTDRDLVIRGMDTMASHQIGRLPVIDEHDRVVGMLTLSSLALRSPQQHAALDTAKEVSRRSARAV